jgi:hypothetical protein
MQATAVNQQHAAAPFLDRLLDEALGLVSGNIRGQVVQVRLGLGLNLATRERANEVVGHAEGRSRQTLALPIHVQWFPRRTRPQRGWRRLLCLPFRHGTPRARRQGPHTLHRSLEEATVFFLGRLLAADDWRRRIGG